MIRIADPDVGIFIFQRKAEIDISDVVDDVASQDDENEMAMKGLPQDMEHSNEEDDTDGWQLSDDEEKKKGKYLICTRHNMHAITDDVKTIRGLLDSRSGRKGVSAGTY